MKSIFKNTFFQILFFGVLLGVVIILVDSFWISGSNKALEAGEYDGPVKMDKNQAYFTKAILSDTVVDFGRVNNDDTVKHTLKITNTGNAPLFIYKSSGPCDCVRVNYSGEMINPGASADITVYFKSKGLKGKQEKEVAITCNTDPVDIRLKVMAEVN
jgi:Protein of unknown function (DUF1573)